MLTFIGFVLSLTFHFGLRKKINLKNNMLIEVNKEDEKNHAGIEKPDKKSNNAQTNQTETSEGQTDFLKKNFLLTPLLYQVTFLYEIFTRFYSELI